MTPAAIMKGRKMSRQNYVEFTGNLGLAPRLVRGNDRIDRTVCYGRLAVDLPSGSPGDKKHDALWITLVAYDEQAYVLGELACGAQVAVQGWLGRPRLYWESKGQPWIDQRMIAEAVEPVQIALPGPLDTAACVAEVAAEDTLPGKTTAGQQPNAAVTALDRVIQLAIEVLPAIRKVLAAVASRIV
jgi:hypothetical protein